VTEQEKAIASPEFQAEIQKYAEKGNSILKSKEGEVAASLKGSLDLVNGFVSDVLKGVSAGKPVPYEAFKCCLDLVKSSCLVAGMAAVQNIQDVINDSLGDIIEGAIEEGFNPPMLVQAVQFSLEDRISALVEDMSTKFLTEAGSDAFDLQVNNSVTSTLAATPNEHAETSAAFEPQLSNI
jgi:hypothetical protein